mgnify:FL=1|tara:strand:+ start:489 stop:815 length:327 start_codon:yes stop_codon:yes gene_type:complete
MSLDFSSQEDRLSYLNEKLDDILDGINSIYGSALTDELVTRMERTIIDFNDEILEIMGEIKLNADKKNQLLHDIIDGNVTLSKPSDVASSSKNDSDNLSAWEKKLEGL